MSDDFLGERKNALENAFFRKQEAKQIDKMREKLHGENTKAGLADASGMTDDHVLEHLVELGLTGETVSALALVPLVEVAWADGAVQQKEREAIMKAAEGKGFAPDSPSGHLLESWLEHDPGQALFHAWNDYVNALSEVLKPEQRANLKSQIVGFARAVAASAGGFLGIKTVSKEEEAALDKIGAAFDKRPSKSK